jgi:pimeloyl-ACP methyl ester carboxylesterase
VARALPPDVAFVALDLRGRGASASLPAPFGMRSHCADVVRVLDALGVESVVAAGHSMGGYVTARLAADHPARVQSLVLIDGGFPLAVPPGIAPSDLVAAVVGPAVARLSMTFTSRAEYLDFWRRHPAFARADAWNDDVEAYLDYDLDGDPRQLRSRVSADAVQADGIELLVDDDAARAVEHVRCPIEIVRVERGLLDEPVPLLPLPVIEAHTHTPYSVTTVPELNHYTLVFHPTGARAVADAIVRASASGA